jgi:hypothetical protein
LDVELDCCGTTEESAVNVEALRFSSHDVDRVQ